MEPNDVMVLRDIECKRLAGGNTDFVSGLRGDDV